MLLHCMVALKDVLGLLQAPALERLEHRVSNMFQPLGTQAETEKQVAYLTFAVTGAIFVVVAALMAYAIARFRRRKCDQSHQEPAQVYGSNQIEAAWTVIPILIVFVLLGVSARVIATLENASPPKNAVKINIIGHQWWWEVYYPDYGIRTSNEIHIPVTTAQAKTAAYLTLQSADVNHSFWIPQLSGKTDLIPNRSNFLWIDAKKPGVYLGNCSEYCGTQHANMLLRVYADDEADWKAWVSDSQRGHSNSAKTETTQGELNRAGAAMQGAIIQRVSTSAPQTDQQFFESLACVNCHAVRGTSAIGKFGPDLTHLMSRHTIGAGVADNTHENLRAWVDDPQQIKPGCLMPSMKLTNAELDRVVAYLETLK